MKYLILTLCLFFTGCSYVNESKEVIWQETRPSVVLKKYEWFKDVSARLDSMSANIDNYQVELETLQKVENPSRLQYNDMVQVRREVAGLKAAYNKLAAEYNSNMAKINYSFANQGMVPEGGEVLPREYREYK